MGTIIAAPVILVLGIFGSCAVNAATYCVSDNVGLYAALAESQSNGEDDLIQLHEGSYSSENGLFDYASSEPHSLTIEGGYVDGGSTCFEHVPRPGRTRLDGSDMAPVLRIQPSGVAGNLTIRDLTVQYGTKSGEILPLQLGGPQPWPGNLIVERLIVRGNTSNTAAAIFQVDGGILSIQNLVFVDNQTDLFYSALTVVAPNGMSMTNSTVAANRAASGSASYAAGIFNTISTARLTNNVFWGNAGTDLRLGGIGGPVDLDHNDVGSMIGLVNSNVGGLSVDPLFRGESDFQLSGNSPLRDAGTNSPLVGVIGDYDASGASRLVYALVDIGAYEVQDAIFEANFD